ncbi:MAG: M15 family metallopeptidase, partial [Leptospirales bacterium]
PPVLYLLGDFNPGSHPNFVRLDRVKIPTGGRTIYLRKEAAAALGRMHADFQKDHPDVEFWITSGARNFNAQRGIWEAKWNGNRKVDGEKLNETIADPGQRALKILEYSSMPGTSRHHWGTDFDVNKLTNSYYKSGQGKILYDWMVENGARYGFCQPYTAGREAGYFEERWHWTYLPLARRFTRDWKRMIADRYPAGKAFAGSKGAADLATIYVESINPDCR